MNSTNAPQRFFQTCSDSVTLTEQRERHHNRVLRMLIAKAPLVSVLDTIARDLESIQPDSRCSIHLGDHAAQELPLARANCWSQPIVSSLGKTLGRLDVRCQQGGPLAPGNLKLIEDRASLAAMAVEKTQAETRLQLAASVFNHAREGIVITDDLGTIVEVNDTFTLITGYARDDVLGKNPRILHSGRQSSEFYKAMWKSLASEGHWSGEVWNRRKDATEVAELLTINAVPDADGQSTYYVGLFTDITAMKAHAQQLEHIAHFDTLTSLPNRVLLADRLQQAMVLSQRHMRTLAVVMLDLDGFTTVNDNYGHNAGDELLVVLAQRMKAALRDGDTLARVGGDEFVVVLADLEHAQEYDSVLERVLQAVAAPVAVGDAVVCVTASMGVTLYPQDDADADLLMRHADQAMYLAKQTGNGRYHLFDVAQDVAVKTQRESLERIRRAMDAHEFVLYYQPKVNMKTGTVIGAEALIRWQHPERGLLAPGDFLPLIEGHAISVELGEWVIDTALAQMTEWHASGVVLGVSVNIGARQLQQGDFVARLSGLLAAHPAVQPRYLELEVLETSALEDMAQVCEVMHACHAMGVRFALDDFGTGYSSLTYLKRLPAAVLKIDQSFVRGMLDDPDDLAIVEGIIGLATAFRRQVIAEGVETPAHGELLLSLGCELAQGYGIARPMPAQAFPGWMSNWRPDRSWEVWRGRSPNRDDQVIVFAEVEHRHWLRSIELYLSGEQGTPPPMDARNCHFGRWRETEGRIRFGPDPAFLELVAVHEQLHALGHALVQRREPGPQGEVRRRLKEMHALREELNVRLRGLVSGSG